MPRSRTGRVANGRSSIYRDAAGRWHGRVSMGLTDDGRPDRRHVTAATEREVTSKVRELEQARDSGHTVTAGRPPTVEAWLAHWVETIAAPTVRAKSLAAYRTAVYRHLIPGVGRHRLNRLSPEHLEALYARMTESGLAPATHQVHRTLRTALNEAVARGRLVRNPATRAKTPRLEDHEVEPLTVEEVRALLAAAAQCRAGVRFSLALALGLRQGEALGLRWADVEINGSVPPTVSIRQALQRHGWQHGCRPPCGHARAADCPNRHSGGLVLVPPKSRAGRRRVVLPGPLADALLDHRDAQALERAAAGQLWQDHDLVFCQPTGKPIDPRKDLIAWKQLLATAGVRDARLHDARHTAATLLLVAGVDARTVMDLLGWSQVTMTRRYQHVIDELRTEAARRIGLALWDTPAGN